MRLWRFNLICLIVLSPGNWAAGSQDVGKKPGEAKEKPAVTPALRPSDKSAKAKTEDKRKRDDEGPKPADEPSTNAQSSAKAALKTPPGKPSKSDVIDEPIPAGQSSMDNKRASTDADKSAERAPRGEHVIYVPYSKLAEVFEKDARNVLMPFAEYQGLMELVRKIGTSVSKPPMPGVISSLEYIGSIEGDLATFKARLVVDALTDDWLKLPVPLRGCTVANVQGGILAAEGSGGYVLLLKDRGRHTILFDLAAPVLRVAEGGKIALHGPAAGSTSFELTVPEPSVEFEISPKPPTPSVTSIDKKTRLLATLGPADSIQVAWRPRAELAEAAPLATASSVVRVDAADGMLHTQTRLDVQLLRGELSSFRFTLPAQERLLDVQTPGLRDWKTTPIDNGRSMQLEVRLHVPVKQKTSLTLVSERSLPAEPFEIAVPKPIDIERHTGILALIPGEEISLSAVDRQSITRIAPSDAPAELQKPNALLFRFHRTDFTLKIEATAVTPRISCVQHALWRLEEGRLKSDFRLLYDIQRAGVFSLRIRLPSGMELEEVAGPEVDRYEMLSDPSGPILNVQLKQRTIGSVELKIALSAPRQDSETGLSLSTATPLDAPSERGFAALLAHESLEVGSDSAKSKGVRPATPVEIAAAGFVVAPEPRMNLAASFRWLARPVEIAVTVQRRKTRLTADVDTRVFVRENAVQTRTVLHYLAQYAPTDVLELAVPEAIADRVEIQGPNVKEKRRGAAKDGFVPFQILLHTRTVGRHPITVVFEEPLKLNASGVSTAEYAVKLVRSLGVERENGQIAVAKERSLSIEDRAERLEPIDPRMLESLTSAIAANAQSVGRPPDSGGEIQLAYRYHRPDGVLRLLATKHEVQRVVETVVSRTLVDSVVPEQGPITHRALFTLISSQRQRLKMRFPQGTRILGVQSAGRTAQPEKDAQAAGEEFLINVSRSTAADVPFTLAVVYEQPRTEEKLELATFVPHRLPELSLSAPAFVGDVSTQRMIWRVWMPRRFAAIGAPTGFEEEGNPYRPLTAGPTADCGQPSDLARWLADWNETGSKGVFEFTTVGLPYSFSSLEGKTEMRVRYGFGPSMIAAGSIAVLAAMLLTLGLRFEHKASLALLAATAWTLATVYRPDAVVRWTSAAGIGLGVGLAFWLGFEAIRFRRERMARELANREKLAVLARQEQLLAQSSPALSEDAGEER